MHSRQLYAALGNTRTFAIDRAFMRHTFQVSFVSHLGLKRKYCFGVPDASTRQRWGVLLQRQIKLTHASVAEQQQTYSRVRQVAEGVALQVLRDAVIAPEDKEGKRGARNGSVSLAYPVQVGKLEDGLGPLQPKAVGAGAAGAASGNGHADSVQASGLVQMQTGKELVLLCRQNSLLGGLLDLLQAGKGNGEGGATEQRAAYGAYGMGVEMGNGTAHGNGNQHGLGLDQANALEVEPKRVARNGSVRYGGGRV
jgi:hypothetical protein